MSETGLPNDVAASDAPLGSTWYAVYDERSGELVSTGTDIRRDERGIPVLRAGLLAVVIAQQPDEQYVWDAQSRSLVQAPEKPPAPTCPTCGRELPQ